MHRTVHQILNLKKIREQASQAIKKTQIAQKKAIDNKILEDKKELKPPFKLGEIVLLYKDFLTTSWSGKLQDKWDGPYIIQSILGKGTYHIKSMNVQDSKIRRVHGNRLKIYALPKLYQSKYKMNPMAITTEALKVTPKDIEENLAKIGGNEDLHESQFFRWMLNNHFKHVYKQEGRNVLINALNEWLEQWEIEQGGQDNVMYEVDERSDVERIEYVLHITKKIMLMDIQENQTLLDTPITDVLPAPLEPMLLQPENFDLFQDLQQTETWDAVVREFVIIDSQENILNYYAAYQALIKEEDRLAKKRKDMLKKFVKEVNTWSHMRFAQPKNNRKSTQGYLTAKRHLG
ncbi:hypothetical protein G6F37_013048 [Rhizopus arrhizus]|nr:hypothetical protein G6F38_012982 [Rhizopus arrhizus]KAG1140066.1 hypothetical protein G6F37_013048 [Rhizopus arrhizus]